MPARFCYPKSFVAKLHKPLTFDFEDKTVAGILAELRDKSGVTVKLESRLAQLADSKTGLKLRPLPLDVLAVHLKTTWNFEKSGDVVLSPLTGQPKK